MAEEEKLYQAYYQPHHFWTGRKAMKELYKITSMSKKDIKLWLAKQALWQVHIAPPQEIYHPHSDVTKPNEQHQFDLLYMPHNVFEGNTYKYILTGVDVPSRFKVGRPVRTKKSGEVAFVLEAINKMVTCSNIQRFSSVIIGVNLQMKLQRCLKNTMLIFEEQPLNTSIRIRLL